MSIAIASFAPLYVERHKFDIDALHKAKHVEKELGTIHGPVIYNRIYDHDRYHDCVRHAHELALWARKCKGNIVTSHVLGGVISTLQAEYHAVQVEIAERFNVSIPSINFHNILSEERKIVELFTYRLYVSAV